ncbi:MAG TPA: NUDIX domain-containing protein [Candidatus Saccharimonadales bacterium]|nr:NUDIX domain-containing protein [Candidatus Saccharimonadales bacterium]
MKSRIIVVGIVKKGSKYLLGRKAPDKGPYPNTWHILGGGINLGEETIEEAIRREIKEEAGIEIQNIQRITFDEDIQPNKYGEMTYYIFLDFIAEYKSGTITPGDDIAEVKWVDKSELEKINVNEPTKKLFKKMGLL